MAGVSVGARQPPPAASVERPCLANGSRQTAPIRHLRPLPPENHGGVENLHAFIQVDSPLSSYGGVIVIQKGSPTAPIPLPCDVLTVYTQSHSSSRPLTAPRSLQRPLTTSSPLCPRLSCPSLSCSPLTLRDTLLLALQTKWAVAAIPRRSTSAMPRPASQRQFTQM